MSDYETKYTVDFRVRKLPMSETEQATYIKAWYELAEKQYQYFTLNTRENMRAFNNAYTHWHTLAEDLERKYAGTKSFGEL